MKNNNWTWSKLSRQAEALMARLEEEEVSPTVPDWQPRQAEKTLPLNPVPRQAMKCGVPMSPVNPGVPQNVKTLRRS
jgi:hypothetical protein